MSDSFDFRNASHFTAGAIGEPGRRVFFLQAGDQHQHVSFKLEKQQAIALATFLRTVLDDLPTPEGEPQPIALVNPVEPQWVVGQIAVGTAEPGEIMILVEELVITDEGDDEDDDNSFDEFDDRGARCTANITIAQAANFIRTVDELVSQSRPPCRICGGPLDPDGHVCPRLN
ncbi:MAG: DUF3090 family protein [Acidimicrobiales bacterium]